MGADGGRAEERNSWQGKQSLRQRPPLVTPQWAPLFFLGNRLCCREEQSSQPTRSSQMDVTRSSCPEGVLGNRELSKAQLPPPLLLTGGRCNRPSSSSHVVTLRTESTRNKGGREKRKTAWVPGPSQQHLTAPSGSFPRGNNPWWFGVSVIAAEP